MNLSLHYDFRAPAFGTPIKDLYSAAVEQCIWGERNGFSGVGLSSHHGCDDDYGPSPIVAAAAIASRTSAMRLVPILALPLHDPLRLAEDVAVLDIISGGRVDLLVVAGYRVEEYEMFGLAFSDRGRLMEEGVTALKQAWTGEPFSYRGRSVRVRPTPLQQPRPTIIMAGDSRGAARRAARLGDAYSAMAGGDSWRFYAEACEEMGREVPARPTGQKTMFVHVTVDPDRAWAQLGRHLLHVNNSYAAWMTADGRSPSYHHADSLEELRRQEVFKILTVDECVAFAIAQDGLFLDPLCGGLPLEAAWESLGLIESEVLPRLQQNVSS